MTFLTCVAWSKVSGFIFGAIDVLPFFLWITADLQIFGVVDKLLRDALLRLVPKILTNEVPKKHKHHESL